MTHKKDQAIGVFDSGMGGLTVLRALKQLMPDESFIYLGDTARLPYGTKSPETVIKYATQNAKLLLDRDIKLLVVACNTASTTALGYLQKQFPQIPIIGVLEPSVRMAVEVSQNHHIAILATETTIQSGQYQALIRQLKPEAKVFAQSCGLFVALAEEGFTDGEIALLTVKKYLEPIISHPHLHDCVILGCTHFPALIKPISKVLGPQINIIDSAHATAKAVQSILEHEQLLSDEGTHRHTTFLVTDSPERFIRVGKTFYGEAIPDHIELV